MSGARGEVSGRRLVVPHPTGARARVGQPAVGGILARPTEDEPRQGRSGRRSPSAGTSKPIADADADAEAVRAADPPASSGTGTHAGTKSSAR